MLTSLNSAELSLYKLLYALKGSLENRYSHVIENRWIWVVLAIVALAAGVGYAFYCTSKGYSFGGKVKWNWPKVWEIGIACKP